MYHIEETVRKTFWDTTQIGLIETTPFGELVKASLTGLVIYQDDTNKLKLLKDFLSILECVMEE